MLQFTSIMDKPTIAFDVDEVLFPLLGAFFPYLNAIHGYGIRPEQMKTYRTEELIGGTAEELLSKMDAFMETEYYEKAEPLAGAVESLTKLHETYRLVIITARHKTFRGPTEKFIDDNFSGLFDDIRYTHTLENPGVEIPKPDICKELGASLLIDDNLHNVIACAGQGIPAILFGNYTWNQTDTLPDGVVRCMDWPAVVEYLEHGL
jgi:5'(3')-deoxyribonucleotidase